MQPSWLQPSAARRQLTTLLCYTQVQRWHRQLHQNNNAFYLLPPDHPVRTAASRLLAWAWFERIVLTVILANCVFMALEEPRCFTGACTGSRYKVRPAGRRM